MLSVMWRPETWADIQALIGVRSETEDLDFKRELPYQGHDFPKQIAAMSKGGGVILYGVDEDKARRVASQITTVPIEGVEERIRNAARDAEPRLEFEVHVLRPTADEPKGVVSVVVPPSLNWPHMVNGRFPVRDGTTTRYLSHAEAVAALEQRDEAAAPPSRPADLFDPLVERLPGITPIRVRSVFRGLGCIRVAVQPISRAFAHPSGAWLGEALDRAVARTVERAETSIDPRWSPRFLKRLNEWKPQGTDIWVAGFAGGDEGSLARNQRASAVFAHQTGHLLMEITQPTEVRDSSGRGHYLCAFEPFVAAGVWAMLHLAGHVFAEAPHLGPLHAGLHLAGFSECVSQYATQAEPDIGSTSHLPTAPPYLMRAITTSAQDLTDRTDRVTCQVLDPWLPAFYDDNTSLYEKVLQLPSGQLGDQ